MSPLNMRNKPALFITQIVDYNFKFSALRMDSPFRRPAGLSERSNRLCPRKCRVQPTNCKVETVNTECCRCCQLLYDSVGKKTNNSRPNSGLTTMKAHSNCVIFPSTNHNPVFRVDTENNGKVLNLQGLVSSALATAIAQLVRLIRMCGPLHILATMPSMSVCLYRACDSLLRDMWE